MGVLKTFLYSIYSIICVLLILMVMVQRGAEEDLGGAFGGGGGGSADSLLGARGDLTMKKITAVLATLFFILSIVIGAIVLKNKDKSKLDSGEKPTSTQEKNQKKSKLDSPTYYLVPYSSRLS